MLTALKTKMLLASYLLNDPTAVHLQRQRQNMTLHLFRKDALLQLIAMFKELLDYVVAENISHQLQGILLNFREHHLFFVAVGCL
jgi:hypothetical protein